MNTLLFASIDRLNVAWNRIETFLTTLHPFTIKTSTFCIVRFGDTKRLVLTSINKPINDCSVEEKIKALNLLDVFLKEVKESMLNREVKVRDAIQQAEKWLKVNEVKPS